MNGYKINLVYISDKEDHNNLEDISLDKNITIDNINDIFIKDESNYAFKDRKNVPLFALASNDKGIYIVTKGKLSIFVDMIAIWDSIHDRFIMTNDVLSRKVSFYHRQNEKGECKSAVIRNNNMEELSRISGRRKIRNLNDISIKTLYDNKYRR